MQAYSINENTLNVKKEIFGMKLIFKTKEQGPDFTRALIKMAKFHIFSTGRYSNMAIQTTSRSYVWEFLTNIPKCTMYNCTEHFCQRPSSHTVPFIEAKCTIIHM